MSKAVLGNQSDKAAQTISGLLEGVAALLLAIKKSDPELDATVTKSSQYCRNALTQRDYANAGNELKYLAQTLYQHWSANIRDSREQYSLLANALSSLDKDHYTVAQRHNFDVLVERLNAEHVQPAGLSRALAKAYTDMLETLAAYRQRNHGEQPVEAGSYREGIVDVRQADLAAVTVRINKDLNSLTQRLAELHPDNDHVRHLKESAEKAAKEGIHFFQGINNLSDAAWLLFKLSDGSIAREREYLSGLTQQLTSLSENYAGTQTLADRSSEGLNEFQDTVAQELRQLSEAGNNSQTLEGLRSVLGKSISSLTDNITRHVDKQDRIIQQQKAAAATQDSTIKALSEEVESIKAKYDKVNADSHIDHLTLTGNRRFFDQQAQLMHDHWKAGNIEHLAIVLLDIDHFKVVNDTYGHVVGDYVLRHISQVLQAEAGKAVNIARYGGEEFAIVAEAPSERNILALAKRLNESVVERPYIQASGEAINLSISVGVCFFTPKQDSIAAVLEAADRALYRAKSAGRNNVWVAGITN
ncbi:MAG: hypothetical protein CL583_16510 [Alteromonadaceae bacterium]|nr:hypothetical protein [Alteromonadaceae bacterium]